MKRHPGGFVQERPIVAVPESEHIEADHFAAIIHGISTLAFDRRGVDFGNAQIPGRAVQPGGRRGARLSVTSIESEWRAPKAWLSAALSK